jgi:hypothetical protein
MVPDRWKEKAARGIVRGLLKIEKFKNLFSFVEKGGWYSASRFVDWMTARLDTANDGAVQLVHGSGMMASQAL